MKFHDPMYSPKPIVVLSTIVVLVFVVICGLFLWIDALAHDRWVIVFSPVIAAFARMCWYVVKGR